MKRTLMLPLLFLFPFILKANNEEIIKSSISNVTVYTQGAQVFRKANYTVKPGITKIIIDNVSNNLVENSIQVKSTGAIVVLDTKFSLYYPKPEEIETSNLPLKVRQDIQRLEDSVSVLGQEIQTLQNELDVLKTSKRIIENNGAVKGTGKVNDSIQLLKETVDYYILKMNEINAKLMTLGAKHTKKLADHKAMNARLVALKQHHNAGGQSISTGPIPRITITVQATAAATGKIDLSYLVQDAGWIPTYDIRSDVSSGNVNLNYKAHVYQNSGELWDNVRLTISTNDPFQNKTKPTLHPWYIDYNLHAQTPRPSRMDNAVLNSQAFKAEGFMEKKTESMSSSEISSNFVTTINQMISAEFVIDLPYTIQSNKEKHIVLVNNIDLKANFKYFIVPKLDKSAYLVAQISKLEELQLVPALATIYFDGSYIGETYLDPSTLDDTLNLSLGKDPNIIVRRSMMKEDSKEKIVGNNVEKTVSYMIEVKNQKSTPIDVTIQDQIPITRNGEIEVTLLDNAKATHNQNTGLLEWQVKIKPKQSEILKYSFKVKHLKDKNVPL